MIIENHSKCGEDIRQTTGRELAQKSGLWDWLTIRRSDILHFLSLNLSTLTNNIQNLYCIANIFDSGKRWKDHSCICHKQIRLL